MTEAVIGDNQAKAQELAAGNLDGPMEKLHRLVGLVVCANVVAVSMEADLGCRVDCEMLSNWFLADIFFTTAFFAETIIRMGKEGAAFFTGNLLNPQNLLGIHFLNCLDCFLVFTRLLALLITVLGMNALPVKSISLLRLFRLNDMLMAAGKYKSLRELYLLTTGIKGMLKTLMWVVIIIILFLLLCAIVMTTLLGQDDSLEPTFDYNESAIDRRGYWGTVARSLMTLGQLLTFNDARFIVWPVVVRYPWVILSWVFFISVTVMMLLNLVTSVMVEGLISQAKAMGAHSDEKMKEMQEVILASLQDIFLEGDEDGNGLIDEMELDQMMHDSRVTDRMDIVNIPVKDLVILHQLCDKGKGVPVGKLFRGAEALPGAARAFDMYRLHIDFARSMPVCDKLLLGYKGCNDQLADILDSMDAFERAILRNPTTDGRDPVLLTRRCRVRESPVSKMVSGYDGIDEDSEFGDLEEEDEMSNDGLDRLATKQSKISVAYRLMSKQSKMSAQSRRAQSKRSSLMEHTMRVAKMNTDLILGQVKKKKPVMPAHLLKGAGENTSLSHMSRREAKIAKERKEREEAAEASDAKLEDVSKAPKKSKKRGSIFMSL